MIYVLTFLAGFWQDTPLNFVNYVLFLLLFLGGIRLMRVTVKSRTITMTGKAFLYLTGVCTALLLGVGGGYEWFRLAEDRERAGTLEGLAYLISAFFWFGVIGSLIFCRKPRSLEPPHP